MKLNFKNAADNLRAEEEKRLPLSHHRILVVDDEEANLRVIGNILGNHYPIVGVTSGKAALELVDRGNAESKFSVIISDYMMPEMSGVEFFRGLKKRQHAAPRIMVTGFAALDNVIEAINEGAVFQYVTKPLDSANLMKIVSEAVAMTEIKDENSRLLGLVKDLMEKSSELAKDNQSLGGQVATSAVTSISMTKPTRRQLCVLFADVRGFTQMSDHVPPEQVIQVLQRIFQCVHSVVYDCGGIIDKHLGDGLMAVFGISGGVTTSGAVQATQRVVAAASEVISKLPPPFNTLRLSLGLAAGDVVLGMLGTEYRAELAVIGRPANLAARLQEFSKHALQSEQGKVILGDFPRVMAICDGSVLEGNHTVHVVDLPKEMRVRDFSEISSVGVIRG